MKIFKINNGNEKVSFQKAHELANEKAKAELGDCMNVAYYDGEQKLVSPTMIACSGDQKDNCGADSYAKALDAEIEIDVNENYKFYYRHIENYETPSPSNHVGADPDTLKPYW